jgi:hypothetical protein
MFLQPAVRPPHLFGVEVVDADRIFPALTSFAISSISASREERPNGW